MVPQDLKESETQRDILYDYWEQIPSIKLIEAEDNLYYNHECRPAISRLIREGVEDSYGRMIGKRRRALTVDEIQQLLDVAKGIKVSRTSLYFHINYLVEMGYLEVVATLKEKRHNIKYYGRTARLTITSTDIVKKGETIEIFKEFGKLLKLNDPSVDVSKIREYGVEFMKIEKECLQEMIEFIEKWESNIMDETIKPWKISEFINYFKMSRPKYRDFWDQFFEEYHFEYP